MTLSPCSHWHRRYDKVFEPQTRRRRLRLAPTIDFLCESVRVPRFIRINRRRLRLAPTNPPVGPARSPALPHSRTSRAGAARSPIRPLNIHARGGEAAGPPSPDQGTKQVTFGQGRGGGGRRAPPWNGLPADCPSQSAKGFAALPLSLTLGSRPCPGLRGPAPLAPRSRPGGLRIVFFPSGSRWHDVPSQVAAATAIRRRTVAITPSPRHAGGPPGPAPLKWSLQGHRAIMIAAGPSRLTRTEGSVGGGGGGARSTVMARQGRRLSNCLSHGLRPH